MADYTIKRGDRGLQIEVPLEQKNDDGAWVPFDMTPFGGAAGGGTRKIFLKKAGTLITGNVVITTGAKTLATYVFDADDLLIAGEYNGEIELTNAAGTIRQTIPNGHDGAPKFFTVEVPEDLADAS